MKHKYLFLLFIISIFLCITSFGLQAQELMYLKQKYHRPVEGQVVDKQGKCINNAMLLGTRAKGDVGKPWVVFSDRNHNKIYTAPDMASHLIKEEASFMERFYVVDEKDKFVKIVTATTNRGDIKIETVHGWIPKKNLLLWTHCIVNDKEITKKALVLNNIDIMKDKGQVDTSKLAKFYAHPDMTNEHYLDFSRLFKLYYVYKVLPDGVLVGKQKSFQTDAYDKAILGWSSLRKITFWDNRVCLEHNSKADAVEERRKHNEEYIIFDTQDAAKVYKNGQMPSPKHIIMKIKDYELERRQGKVIRFPILETDTDDILKVCAIGEIVNKAGEMLDVKDIDKAIKKLQKTLREVETVNILFVVDGTKGMGNTFKQLSKSIDIGLTGLKNSGQDIKMGLVVYRNDKAEKNKIEIKSLRKSTEISKYLKEVDTNYEFETEKSAFFEGLKAGIENAGLKRKQTNIIMIFGREGNVDDDLQDEIVKLVADKNCHIMAMQVDNKDSDIYDDFQFQLQNIILDAAAERYKKYDQANGNIWKPRFDEAYTGGSDHRKYKLKNTSAIGTLIYPSAGREIPMDKLLNETVEVLKNIENNIEKYANRLKNMIEGTGTGTTGFERFDPAVALLLDDLTKGEINAVSQDNFQGSKVGYVVLKNNTFKHEMYEYVLFLDNAELSETIRILELFISEDLTHEDLLTSIEDTWRTILRKYEGVNVLDYEDLTLEQIHIKVFGLPVQSDFLSKIKLKNVKNMSYEQANNYIEVMTNSHSRLNNILRTGKNYPFSFSNNKDVYYWILERELP